MNRASKSFWKKVRTVSLYTYTHSLTRTHTPIPFSSPVTPPSTSDDLRRLKVIPTFAQLERHLACNCGTETPVHLSAPESLRPKLTAQRLLWKEARLVSRVSVASQLGGNADSKEAGGKKGRVVLREPGMM